jgi:starch phosphorylase
VGVNGQLEETEVLSLPPVENSGSVYLFAREFVPRLTGRLGYSLRVSPNHCDDPLTRPCNALMKWN